MTFDLYRGYTFSKDEFEEVIFILSYGVSSNPDIWKDLKLTSEEIDILESKKVYKLIRKMAFTDDFRSDILDVIIDHMFKNHNHKLPGKVRFATELRDWLTTTNLINHLQALSKIVYIL